MQNHYHPLIETPPNCSFSIPAAIYLCNVYRYSSSLQIFISNFFLPIQVRSFLTPYFSLLISLLKRNNFPVFLLEAIQQKLPKIALFYCYIQNNFLLIYIVQRHRKFQPHTICTFYTKEKCVIFRLLGHQSMCH